MNEQTMNEQMNEQTVTDRLTYFMPPLSPESSLLFKQVLRRTVRRYDPESLVERITLVDVERIATAVEHAYKIGTVVALNNAFERMDKIFKEKTGTQDND